MPGHPLTPAVQDEEGTTQPQQLSCSTVLLLWSPPRFPCYCILRIISYCYCRPPAIRGRAVGGGAGQEWKQRSRPRLPFADFMQRLLQLRGRNTATVKAPQLRAILPWTLLRLFGRRFGLLVVRLRSGPGVQGVPGVWNLSHSHTSPQRSLIRLRVTTPPRTTPLKHK